ncbi:casein kinase I [Scaptodrosophila lebanonensis]|uniref:non-specific serine/threonine protein kinase n=1 Tax=Drosophila lebanonensis TaxID=7225 RepID=A0A6J2TDN9_DROLE|nr:casein kinase I [Scaptodrosophila lebanonensis]
MAQIQDQFHSSPHVREEQQHIQRQAHARRQPRTRHTQQQELFQQSAHQHREHQQHREPPLRESHPREPPPREYQPREQAQRQHQEEPQWKGERRRNSYQTRQRSSKFGSHPVPDIIVGGKYQLISRIGNGSFGELYRAIALQNDERVAVKLESSSVKHPQLPREAKIYSILRGGVGFPQIRHYGTEGVYNVLVLDLLGPTLEDLLNFCERSFSMKTTLMLADQILARVEYVHMNCLLHRDIKPENFLMGLGRQRTRVFMIDFGLAKKFYSPRTQQHISYNEKHDLVGTARYASMHAHYAEQGRRDDLESVGYLLLYFVRGFLPWQGIKADTRLQKYEKIAESKSNTPLTALCAGLPFEFYMYMKYCRTLHFAEQPDYMYLRQLFKVLFRNQNMLYDYLYDWVDMKMHGERERRQQRERQGERDRQRVKEREKTARHVCLCSYHQHKQRQHRQQRHQRERDREREQRLGQFLLSDK